LLTPACVLQPAAPEGSVRCEDVEEALLARVRRSIDAASPEALNLSVQDDADARYVVVEVRAPGGQHLFSYRVERVSGVLSRIP
jgi:hypothetical protein